MGNTFHRLLLTVKPRCADYPTQWWFSDSEEDEHTVKAKEICAGCPIRFSCQDYAIKNNEQYGVFGGMTPTERRREVRRRKKA